MVASLLSAGGYSATDATDDFLWIAPRLGPDGSKPAVIVCHGAGQGPANLVNFGTTAEQTRVVLALANAGYPIIAPYGGGDHWGNDAAIARVGDAKTYAQANGAKPGKVVLLGISMGALAVYGWARANTADVACMVGLYPASDLNDFHANNRLGTTAAINTAYGGTYVNGTHGPTHNPESYKAQLAGLSAQVWYATDDTVVIPSTVTSVTTAIGGVDLHTMTGGHAEATLAAVDTDVVLSFIGSHT